MVVLRRPVLRFYYDSEWQDRLISYNGESISYEKYDDNGKLIASDPSNPLIYRGNELTWTMGRQLAEYRITNGTVETEDDTVYSYTYNEDGIRTSKTVDNVKTEFYLDGTNIIEQITSDTVLHFHYDSNDEIIGFTYNEADYFYIKNAMSDIIGIVDNSGNLVVSYAYDAWGKVLSVTGSNTELGNLNPFRYRSYYYDTETEFYYLQSRYYDPEVCRFINSDDVNFIGATGTVGSYNAFAYCENNPVNGWDYLGYSAIAVFQSKYTSLVTFIIACLVGIGVTGGSASTLNPTGVAIGAGILVVGIAGVLLNANTQTAVKTETRILSDATLRTTKSHVFKLAYIDKNGNLQKVGKSLTFVEALSCLGVKKASVSLTRNYRVTATKPSECKTKDWGVYSSNQAYAKALAVMLGCNEPPEAHGIGYYGHYHDKDHKIHIWYGSPMKY